MVIIAVALQDNNPTSSSPSAKMISLQFNLRKIHQIKALSHNFRIPLSNQAVGQAKRTQNFICSTSEVASEARPLVLKL
jgi:hypothetical protein